MPFFRVVLENGKMKQVAKKKEKSASSSGISKKKKKKGNLLISLINLDFSTYVDQSPYQGQKYWRMGRGLWFLRAPWSVYVRRKKNASLSPPKKKPPFILPDLAIL